MATGFDIVAWVETQDGPALMAGAADQVYRVNGDDIIVKDRATLLGGIGCYGASTPIGGYIDQPSIKIPYRFHRGGLLTYNVARTAHFTDWLSRPFPLKENEKMQCYTQNDTNEYSYMIAFLLDQAWTRADQDAPNPTHSIRLTGSTTITANVWSLCTLTEDNALPEGTYHVVGMQAYADLTTGAYGTNIAARLVLPGNNWRPGVLCTGGHRESGYCGYVVEDQLACYEKWPLLDDIYFPHDQIPDAEFLSGTACNKEEVFLQLVKTG
jgi:hypothetical protein